MTISRYFHTLRHLRSEQLWWQVKYKVFRRFFPVRKRRPPANLRWRIPIPKKTPFLWPPVDPGSDLKKEIDWNGADRSRLQGYLLNYFDFLSISDVGLGRELIEDWIARCRSGIGWESGPASHRIVNWIKFITEKCSESEDREFLDLAAGDLFIQADRLSRNLERHINGNHLLKNAVALLFAGTFLQNDRFLKSGGDLLEETVKEQFLPDGGHYERSPMYHLMMLHDLLDCMNLGLKDGVLEGLLLHVVRKGLSFMDAVRHPDGEIALFNDSVLDAAPDPASVLRYAREVAGVDHEESTKGVLHFPDSGYAVLSAKDLRMIVDVGSPGPDHFPAHAHCGLLGFELSVKGRRMIVDSGSFDYEQGGMREYCRSTTAHNTVKIDGCDQSDMWGAFRMGRRARLDGVRIERGDGGGFLVASHDGYLKTLGVWHVRRIAWFPEGTFLIQDLFEGTGRHCMVGFLHFHPDCRVVPSDSAGTMIVEREDAKLHVHSSLTGGVAVLEKGWYCPSFGKRREQEVLTLILEAELPAVMVTCLETVGRGPMHVKEELEKAVCAS